MKTAYLLLLSLAACSGELTPEGSRRQYVTSSVKFPANMTEAQQLSLLEDSSNKSINAFGLATMGTLPLQVATARAIVNGEDSQLVQLQARDLAETVVAGIQLAKGANPSPSPCSAPDSCGRHLAGNGTFDLADGMPSPLIGSIRAGTFLSEDGDFTIQISLDGERVLDMPLLAAKISLAGVTDTKITTGIISGGVSRDFITGNLITELTFATSSAITRDCPTLFPCTCTPGTAGSTLVVAFDADHNCNVSANELMTSATVQALLRADLNINGTPALSFGMGFGAIAATFPED